MKEIRDRVLQLEEKFSIRKNDPLLQRIETHLPTITSLYQKIYGQHPEQETQFSQLLRTLTDAHTSRSSALVERDTEKAKLKNWYLSNELTGMSLYVDRFSGDIRSLKNKLPYLQQLGVNLMHLMPLFKSPEGESDGGYAVSDFRQIDPRFGKLEDLRDLQMQMHATGMYLMLDIVLNHTSHQHEWVKKARAGDPVYKDFFYMYPDRTIPDQFEHAMPEIFPESAPGNFTYVPELNHWVMTVFHNYQWDLNYSNPMVFVTMVDTILFYANLGVDILRIDAPAFIWKQPGTSCQNLPEAHSLLRLIKQCVQVAAPGMALLGEAIVAPAEIMKYFGTHEFTSKECDVAYNATHMALQWDALATGDTKVMLAAQHELLQKPLGTTWITYTRCHDDIGLGYDDEMIRQAGYDPYEHRKFLKEYLAGNHPGSTSRGALFSVNPKTNDARISGSLASLCGLEEALDNSNADAIAISLQKILMMQAHSLFLGGIPMLFYGDECGYTNDYSYLNEPGKSYDNRWMHRPVIDWKKNKRIDTKGTIEERVFSGTRELIAIRKKIKAVSDLKNLEWISPHNPHVACYRRALHQQQFYGVFNFCNETTYLTWYAFRERGTPAKELYDHWSKTYYRVGQDHEHLALPPYAFFLFEVSSQ